MKSESLGFPLGKAGGPDRKPPATDVSVPRRPTGFWHAFNKWYRSKMVNGTRPCSATVKEWYAEFAPSVWPSPEARPGLQEAQSHAKGLRSTEEVKKYNKNYKAKRGICKAPSVFQKPTSTPISLSKAPAALVETFTTSNDDTCSHDFTPVSFQHQALAKLAPFSSGVSSKDAGSWSMHSGHSSESSHLARSPSTACASSDYVAVPDRRHTITSGDSNETVPSAASGQEDDLTFIEMFFNEPPTSDENWETAATPSEIRSTSACKATSSARMTMQAGSPVKRVRSWDEEGMLFQGIAFPIDCCFPLSPLREAPSGAVYHHPQAPPPLQDGRKNCSSPFWLSSNDPFAVKDDSHVSLSSLESCPSMEQFLSAFDF